MKKVLIATDKPFAPVAAAQIESVLENAGYQVVRLEKYTLQSDLIQAVADVDAMIVRSDKVDSAVLDAAMNLKIVVRAGAGYDNVDTETAKTKGVCVMNTPGQNSNAVAELVFGMLVYAVRNFYNGSSGGELRGKKIGIHGFGAIGNYVSLIAKGFGMEVYAYDVMQSADAIRSKGVIPVNSTEELYSTCSIVSVHIPANSQTKKSINASLLNMMPENAMIVNTARKEVIDEEDMLSWMEARKDVKYLSDIAPDCAQTFADKFAGRFFFTPKKMGAQTEEANVNAGIAAASQIVGFFEKGDDTFRVN